MYVPIKELINFGIHCLGKMAAGLGVVTMLIRSGFQELKPPDEEAVAQSNCPENNGKIQGEEIYRTSTWL